MHRNIGLTKLTDFRDHLPTTKVGSLSNVQALNIACTFIILISMDFPTVYLQGPKRPLKLFLKGPYLAHKDLRKILYCIFFPSLSHS